MSFRVLKCIFGFISAFQFDLRHYFFETQITLMKLILKPDSKFKE
jgi:hypothetical protein